VKLTAVGAPKPQVSETTVTRADAPKVLEYNWGDKDIRWELEAFGGGTRLTLWHTSIAASSPWVLPGGTFVSCSGRLLIGTPIGRIVGARAMKFDWARLNSEYAKQFGIETRNWRLKRLKNRENKGGQTNHERSHQTFDFSLDSPCLWHSDTRLYL